MLLRTQLGRVRRAAHWASLVLFGAKNVVLIVAFAAD